MYKKSAIGEDNWWNYWQRHNKQVWETGDVMSE